MVVRGNENKSGGPIDEGGVLNTCNGIERGTVDLDPSTDKNKKKRIIVWAASVVLFLCVMFWKKKRLDGRDRGEREREDKRVISFIELVPHDIGLEEKTSEEKKRDGDDETRGDSFLFWFIWNEVIVRVRVRLREIASRMKGRFKLFVSIANKMKMWMKQIKKLSFTNNKNKTVVCVCVCYIPFLKSGNEIRSDGKWIENKSIRKIVVC